MEHEVPFGGTPGEALAALSPLFQRLGLTPAFRCTTCRAELPETPSITCARCGGPVALLYTSGVLAPRPVAGASEQPLLLSVDWVPGRVSVAAVAWSDAGPDDTGTYLRFLGDAIGGTLDGSLARGTLTARLAEMRRLERAAVAGRVARGKRMGAALLTTLLLAIVAGFAVFR